jgi:hypothetical protein
MSAVAYLRHALVAGIACVAVAAAAGPSRAAFVVVPNANAGVEGSSNNGFPYNLNFFNVPSMRYQQVFDASQFAGVGGPILISEIRYRTDSGTGNPFATVLPNIRLDLSTTAVNSSTIGLNFASNIGADNTTVHNGALALSSAAVGPGPRPFDVVVSLTTPFVYDPSAGNLLLDVRNFGGGLTTQFDAASNTGVTKRVYAENVNAANGVVDPLGDKYGLITGFTYESANVVPVPASAVLFATGGAFGLFGLRRRVRG